MANKLIVSLSPHVHSGDSVQKNMYGVIIALVPALLVSFYMFGLGAVIVTLTSVVACLFFEWAITKFILKRERTTIIVKHSHFKICNFTVTYCDSGSFKYCGCYQYDSEYRCHSAV